MRATLILYASFKRFLRQGHPYHAQTNEQGYTYIRKEGAMEQVGLLLQVLFWLGLGLWFLGLRFQYLEPIIGVIALVNGLLLII